MSAYRTGLLCLAIAGATPLAAGAQSRCTQETLQVRGTPVGIGYCVDGPLRSDGGDEVVVPVSATYASPSGSLREQRDLRFISGESVSRILENVRLDRIGMTGVLHLTLTYARGVVRIEGALLTPGGLTIK